MPDRAQTKEELVTSFRCNQILEAARKVFAVKGFHRATMDDIAGATGIAKGTLYLYFSSKEEIYMETLQRGIDAFHERVFDALKQAKSAREALMGFVRTSLEYFDQNKEFFKIYHTEFANFFGEPGGAYERFKGQYHRQLELLESVLEEGVRQGVLRPLRIAAAAVAIHATLRALVRRRLLEEVPSTIEEDAECTFDLIWKGVRAV